MEPQAPEIRDAARRAPIVSASATVCQLGRRELALMISPVDVSTSVCLSREADDSLCKHPALSLPRNPRGSDRHSSKLRKLPTALAIAITTVDWDKRQQVLCPSRICQVCSLDCESVLDRLAPSPPYSALPCHCTYACKPCARSSLCSPVEDAVPRTGRGHRHTHIDADRCRCSCAGLGPSLGARQTSPSIRGHRRNLSRACMLHPMPYALCPIPYTSCVVPCPALPCFSLGACCAP